MWKKINFDDISAMSVATHDIVLSMISKKLKSSDFFNFVIPGGKTPSLFFSLLAEDKNIQWERIRIFWTDERFVPQNDDRSNYGNAKKIFLDKIPIPQENIFRIDCELKSASLSAENYGLRVKNVLGDFPVFDLILAGMGADGHFASIFPNSGALDEIAKIAIAVPAPITCEPRVERISLGLSVFNSARKLIFMVQGAEKLKMLDMAFERDGQTSIPVSFLDKKLDIQWMISA